ncbi:hypothetical protein BH11BAC3_BH11BAC3_14060 [soil metagenome]
MKLLTSKIFYVFIFPVFISCSNTGPVITPCVPLDKTGVIIAEGKSAYEPSAKWKQYWYDGKAELTSYNLKQSRYGEIHDGNVVNVFVTEDFSKVKQVKLDEPEKAGSDRLPVLKLNQSFKFITGIYPYSMMLSTFSPVDLNQYPHLVKITASSQEWCGSSFFQLNNRNKQYQVELRSYFEKENDQDLKLDQVLLEDEWWNMIRIHPEQLPTGEHIVLPGALYLRLSHKTISSVKAQLSIVQKDSTTFFTAIYPELNRTLSINFENKLPYTILGWSDSFAGFDGKVLTTTATRNKMIRTDYWRRHLNIDRKLREDLGLPVNNE